MQRLMQGVGLKQGQKLSSNKLLLFPLKCAGRLGPLVSNEQHVHHASSGLSNQHGYHIKYKVCHNTSMLNERYDVEP
jgi:hypothetical protein